MVLVEEAAVEEEHPEAGDNKSKYLESEVSFNAG